MNYQNGFEINGCKYIVLPDWNKKLENIPLINKGQHMRMYRPAIAEYEKEKVLPPPPPATLVPAPASKACANLRNLYVISGTVPPAAIVPARGGTNKWTSRLCRESGKVGK